jgi:hypothetical protein
MQTTVKMISRWFAKTPSIRSWERNLRLLILRRMGQTILRQKLQLRRHLSLERNICTFHQQRHKSSHIWYCPQVNTEISIYVIYISFLSVRFIIVITQLQFKTARNCRTSTRCMKVSFVVESHSLQVLHLEWVHSRLRTSEKSYISACFVSVWVLITLLCWYWISCCACCSLEVALGVGLDAPFDNL